GRNMRKGALTGICLVMVAGFVSGSLEARPTKQELSRRATYKPQDATRAHPHINAAMTLPMEALIREATLNNPEAMMRYGLALELGRPPATHALNSAERDVLKAGYRSMIDLYLTSGDK